MGLPPRRTATIMNCVSSLFPRNSSAISKANNTAAGQMGHFGSAGSRTEAGTKKVSATVARAGLSEYTATA